MAHWLGDVLLIGRICGGSLVGYVVAHWLGDVLLIGRICGG